MPSEYREFNRVKTYIEYNNLVKCNWDAISADKQKTPLIIQHGHAANHYFVKPIFDYFSQLGWPVLMFDWRGHGLSQKNLNGQYKLDLMVEDLHAVIHEFLEDQFGYKKVFLLGHSMGGFLAMKYTLKYPVDILKLLPVATTACVAANWLIKFGMRYMIRGYKKNYDAWFNTRKKKQALLGLEFFPQWTHPELMPDHAAVIELLEEMLSYDIRPYLKQIRCPTKVWVGTKDDLKNGAKFIARSIPNAQFEMMEGMEHNIPIHARNTLPPKIEQFLRE